MKDRSFAAKAAKMKGAGSSQCSVCGEPYVAIRLSKTEKYSATQAYRFAEKIVMVCKCNQKEVWG